MSVVLRPSTPSRNQERIKVCAVAVKNTSTLFPLAERRRRPDSKPVATGPGGEENGMRDVLYVMGTVAFFALCVLLVRGCDLIVGPDELEGDAELFDDERDDVVTSVAA